MKNLKNLKIYEKAEDVPLGLDLYKQAADLGMTFWQFLEVIQPSKPGETLDAFERQLRASGIVTKSQPERGIYSSPGEYFFQSDRPGSAILFPVLLQKTALWAKLNRIADINTLVATTRTIAGTSAYQALFIDDSEISGTGAMAHGRRFRVDQRGQFPRVKISWSEKTNAVTKHGVQLDWTYEFVRRASIELMQTVVARLMLQDQKELLNDAVSLAINGDGGPNAAATVKTFCTNGTTPGANEIFLTGTSLAAGVINYEGYMKFIGQMQPYAPSIICGSLNTLVKLITMEKPNMDPTEIITRIQDGARTQGTAKLDQNLFPNVKLVLVDSVPESHILALDPAFALERVIELGSDIQEVEKVIKNQTESMVISIADNVSKIFAEACQVLDFSSAARTS